jgi:hypothetical protein
MVEVSDANNCTATDNVTVTVLEFVFLADDKVDITGQKNSEGNIHSNKDIAFHDGVKPFSIHTGNLTAKRDINVGKDNKIIGDATAHGRVINSGIITGNVSSGAPVATVAIPPVPPFSAGTTNVSVAKNQTRILNPGNYKNVDVAKGATLKIRSGTYNINQLTMAVSTTLDVEIVSGNPVTINAVNKVSFNEFVGMTLNPATSSTTLLTINSRESNKVEFGKGSVVFGNFVAPDATVMFDMDIFFKGAVYSDQINVLKNTRFVPHSSVVPLPKVAPSPDEPEIAEIPVQYGLDQNYPNPFNPSTTIQFDLPEESNVRIIIYDILGREVTRVVDGMMGAGRYNQTWNGQDGTGRSVASGVYIVRIEARSVLSERNLVSMRKMMLMK